jgi:septal ring factor EnvC (AmiA/AmiB activator)
MWARRMTSFRKVHTTALIAVAGVAILLAGCSQGESQAQVAQAQQSAAQAQAQKDTQASLAAQVQQLKAQAAQTAAAKAAAAQAAATQAAALKAAQAAAAKTAAQATPAQPTMTACDGNVSAAANTSCAFALNVENAFYASGGGYTTVSVYSPVTGLYYTMTCVPGVPTVCTGGNNAVVDIR